MNSRDQVWQGPGTPFRAWQQDQSPSHPAAAAEATRGGFRALLQASLAISDDLSLPDVLHRIVTAACRLTTARYGALAVLDERGAICQMVHAGIDDETAACIGSLPAAKGVLKALIADPRPLRLRRVSDHAHAVGFPEGHPAVSAFLGVPIRVRDGVFGNLYVADPVAEEFTEEDEEVICALAAHAGIAVENARLYEQEQRGREWLQATLGVTRSLLGSAGEEPLATVARAIRSVSQSDFALVILPAAGDTLMVEIAAGDGTEHLPGYTYPRAGSVSGEVLQTGEVVLVPDARTHPMNLAVRALAREIDVGPLMFVPLVGHNGARGVLAVGRHHSRRPFHNSDVEPALAFANHATLALELADGRRYQQRMNALEGRDRIAGELHDQVLQRLFATGMSMQAVAGAVSAPHADRIQELIRATDETIVCIRSMIQNLYDPGARPPLTV